MILSFCLIFYIAVVLAGGVEEVHYFHLPFAVTYICPVEVTKIPYIQFSEYVVVSFNNSPAHAPVDEIQVATVDRTEVKVTGK
jgi:hypothetical protein